MITAVERFWSHNTLTKACVVACAIPVGMWTVGAVEGAVRATFNFLNCLVPFKYTRESIGKNVRHVIEFEFDRESLDLLIWNSKMLASCITRAAVSTLPIFGTYLGLKTFQYEYYFLNSLKNIKLINKTPRIPHLHDILYNFFKPKITPPEKEEGLVIPKRIIGMKEHELKSILKEYYTFRLFTKIYTLVESKMPRTTPPAND